MATNVVAFKIEGEQVSAALKIAREQLGSANGELVLDFSNVKRLDAAGLKAMEELVATAEGKAVKLVLQGANVDVYKVLKLVKLAARVSVVNE
jgi:anti-anti-sigma regulatory factor